MAARDRRRRRRRSLCQRPQSVGLRAGDRDQRLRLVTAAAAREIGGGGIGGDPADFEDDEEPLFAIACPSRSGMLQKESTGLRHQVCV